LSLLPVRPRRKPFAQIIHFLRDCVPERVARRFSAPPLERSTLRSACSRAPLASVDTLSIHARGSRSNA